MENDIKKLLQGVQARTVSVEDALLQLKAKPFDDLGYAKVDLHRKVRQGANEVIYGEGKTSQQIIGILESMAAHGQNNVLITRLDAEKAAAVAKEREITYYPAARVAIAGEMAAGFALTQVTPSCGT